MPGSLPDRVVSAPDGTAAVEPQAARPYVIVVRGAGTGAVRALPAGRTIVGRAVEADQRFEDPNISRRHAVFTVDSDGGVVVEDLGSSNGTFVNDVRVQQHALKDGDQIRFGPGVILTLSYQEDGGSQQVPGSEPGIKDALTAAHTESYLRQQLESEIARAQRHNLDLALLVLAVDQLQEIGKAHGTQGQDLALRTAAGAIRKILRAGDVLARADQKFMVLAHDISDEGVVVLAQRIRRTVRAHALPLGNTPVPLTASIGVATLSADKVRHAAALIREAERHLAKGKRRAHGNCIAGNAVKTFLRNGGGSNTTVKLMQGQLA